MSKGKRILEYGLECATGAYAKERNGAMHIRNKMVINHGFWGHLVHFCHFCNGLIAIGMYKYVREEIVMGEDDGACKLQIIFG
jgi:hypothetical protein